MIDDEDTLNAMDHYREAQQENDRLERLKQVHKTCELPKGHVGPCGKRQSPTEIECYLLGEANDASMSDAYETASQYVHVASVFGELARGESSLADLQQREQAAVSAAPGDGEKYWKHMRACSALRRYETDGRLCWKEES